MADKKGVLSMTGDVTAAQATLFQRAQRGGGFFTRARRQVASIRAGQRKRRATRSGSGTGSKARGSSRQPKGRLKKGSPAAKRRMAALRKMQRK